MSAPPGVRRVPLSGELGTTSLAEVLSTLEMRSTTAKVRIDSEMGGAEVEVVLGKIVEASTGDLHGSAALLAMLGIADGHFEVVEMPLAPRSAIVPNVGALIAEKERRIVQWRQLSERAPPLSAVLKPMGAGSTETEGSEPGERLLSLVDGRRTIAEIIEESGVDAVEALGLLIDAISRGLAQVEAPQLSLFPLGAGPVHEFVAERAKPVALSGGSGALRKKTVIGMGLEVSEDPAAPEEDGADASAGVEPSVAESDPPPREEAEVRRADVRRIINVTAARPEAVPVPKRRSRASTTPPPVSVTKAADVEGPRSSAPISVAPLVTASRPTSDPPEQKARGRRYIGRYEVLCRIGSGGMGSVYLSRMTSEVGFKRLFALKVLRSHLLEDSVAAQKFLEEARLAGYVHHPNVVSVLDAGFEGSQPFLVMDYVEGGSLKQLLSADPARRPPELIVPVVLDALSGLHAAHQLESDDGTPLNIVHSDVSPENLMVGVDGVCRLTDFGVAKPGGLRRRNEAAHGKPGYMAPEQITGGRVDRRADIFAMGALLYNSLTGTKLFEAQTVEETLRQVVACRIAPPSMIGLRPPPSLDLVCVRALDRDPGRRFETAEEMMLELRRIALREGLLGPTNVIAEWVRQSVGRELAQRRLTVLDASRSTRVSAVVPQARTADSSLPPADVAPAENPRVSTSPPSQEPNSLSRTIVISSISSPKRGALIAAACISAIAVLVTLFWPDYVSKLFKLKTDGVISDRVEMPLDPATTGSGDPGLGTDPASELAPPGDLPETSAATKP